MARQRPLKSLGEKLDTSQPQHVIINRDSETFFSDMLREKRKGWNNLPAESKHLSDLPKGKKLEEKGDQTSLLFNIIHAPRKTQGKKRESNASSPPVSAVTVFCPGRDGQKPKTPLNVSRAGNHQHRAEKNQTKNKRPGNGGSQAVFMRNQSLVELIREGGPLIRGWGRVSLKKCGLRAG